MLLKSKMISPQKIYVIPTALLCTKDQKRSNLKSPVRYELSHALSSIQKSRVDRRAAHNNEKHSLLRCELSPLYRPSARSQTNYAGNDIIPACILCHKTSPMAHSNRPAHFFALVVAHTRSRLGPPPPSERITFINIQKQEQS